VKRWNGGKWGWRSWAVGTTLIILFLVQLLIVPHAVRTVAASVWVERKPVGDFNRNWLACASDATGQRLLAGDNSGRLWISADCGASWSKAGTPAGDMDRHWQECASDSDGSSLIAGVYVGRLYTSMNFGASWTAAAPGGLTTDQNWKAVASDADGSTLIAGVYAKRLWLSVNGGSSWNEPRPAGNADQTWQAVACDASGLRIMALVRNGRAYASADAGVTWSELRPAGDVTRPWKACAMDADGSTLVAAAYPGRLYRSVDAGTTWAELRPVGDVDRNWQAVAVDVDGFHIIAIEDGGSVWTSSNGGATWSDVKPAGVTAAAWQCCASSADGFHLVAGAYPGRLYTGLSTWSLFYACTAGGVITGATSQTVNQGASGASVIAVPSSGFHFVRWSDGSTINPRTDTNVTADITVTATFAVDAFAITPSAGANGAIDPSGSVSVSYGDTQSFTITPGTGYHVQDVLVDSVSVGAVFSCTFTNVTAAHTIAASFAINTYTLTVDVTGSGSVAHFPDQTTYTHGTSVQLTATPATGWHFTGWSGDLSGTTNPATITIDGNKAITGTFAINTFTITPFAGPNGSISPATPQTVDYDSNLTFTITPNTGYHVLDALVDGSSVGAVTSYIFTNLTENYTIAASFAIDTYTDTYTLTYTAGANGTISGTSPQTVNQGATGAPVTAVPHAGYHFVSWSDGIFTAARTDTAVTGSVSVTATFAIDTFTVTPSAASNGSISPSTTQTVDYDSNLTFTINPGTGYHVLDVLVDGGSVGEVTSYTLTSVVANDTISATFAINTFTLTYAAGANGSISGASPQTVNYGASGSAGTAVPNMGYHFVQWSDGNGNATRTDSNVTVNISVTAAFAININTYTLTVDVTGSGSVAKSPDQTSYDHGISIQLTATPATYWHFVGWSGDLTSSGNPATVTIDGNKTITATFAIDTFTVTPSAGSNGSISPVTPQTVDYDGSLTFIMTPNTGYHVLDVLVDGSSVGAVTSYTFTNIRAAHTISVTFAINPITISTYTVTYTAGVNGTISGTSPQTVNQGASGTAVTATPDAGYHFVSWSDGIFTAARTDTNVTVNINVSASFAININIHRYALTANVSGSGSVAKSPDQSSYTHGISVQLTATPATGWHFVGWSGDLSGTTNPATITMDVSKTVTATYAPLPHPVSRHTMVLTIDIKTMTVDGARVTLDAPAALLEDRTLVPLRALVEHLGGTISWNAKTRQVTLKVRGITISLTIGKSTALVNGKLLAIDPKNSKVVPVLSSSRTMLPLRFVAENLGLQVEWDAKTRTITVNWED